MISGVADDARRALAELLGAGDGASPSAALVAPVDDLVVEVRGLGRLQLPVPEDQARQLCAMGRRAPYGKGTSTLVDPAVRDTWEVPKTRVRIDRRRWNRTLVPALEHLRRDLGLPDGCELRAEMHSMLVYAPGQFFLRHQDSEIDDAMVGSLVVTLPSSFTGGALEVEQRGKVTTYRGSKSKLSLVAFYSDCRHEIKPVRSGHRVALTYDLLLGGDPTTAPVAEEGAEHVRRLVERHFADPAGPHRLVYLLDHEYTSRGLSWSHLKAHDIASAALLRAGAERAGCEAVLGLADIQETWSAYESEPLGRPWRYSGWGDAADEDWDGDGGASAGDYDLTELIEESVSLERWLDPRRGVAEEIISLPVGDDEVCAASPTSDLDPYRSEYEGYMGNWGNTLDRWYHRGAVVVWPAAQDFAVRAEMSPSSALDTLAALVRRGELTAAREAVDALGSRWDQTVQRVVHHTLGDVPAGQAAKARRSKEASLLGKALRVAAGLGDPAAAATLLAPFGAGALAPGHARHLAALVESYGRPWFANLVGGWSSRGRTNFFDPAAPGGPDRAGWLERLGSALGKHGDAGRAAAAVLAEDAWEWLREQVRRSSESQAPGRRARDLGALGRPSGRCSTWQPQWGPPASWPRLPRSWSARTRVVAGLGPLRRRETTGTASPSPSRYSGGPLPPGGRQPAWTVWLKPASALWRDSSPSRCARRTTGRSCSRPPAAASCASHSPPSSPTRTAARSSGRSPSRNGPTCTPASTGPSSPSSTVPGAPAGPTPSC